jgi:hypothetical protein
MTYIAKTASELRIMRGSLLEKVATENALIEAELGHESGINLSDTATDGAGTGHPVFEMGTLDTPKSVTPVDDLVPFQIYLKSVENSGVEASSVIGIYCKVWAGTKDQSNNRAQCALFNTKLDYDVFDAYAVQAHVTVNTEMKTKNTNAHITGISGKAVMTASATKGWVTGGLFIIEGAGTCSEMCSVVSLVQEAGCGAAQSMLYINNDGTATTGLYYQGYFTKGIDFTGATLSQGSTNYALAFGTIATTKSFTPTDTIIPVQVNVTSIANSGTDGDQTIGACYFKTAALTAAQADHQLATCMVRTQLTQNIWDAYGLQSHLQLYGSMSTHENNAHLTAISGKVTFANTPTITKGWITAGLFIIEGAGTASQMCHGVSIVEEAESTGAQSMLHLNTDVGTTPYFSFAGADGTGKSIYTHTAAGTQLGTIKILVNGSAKWLPFMQAE